MRIRKKSSIVAIMLVICLGSTAYASDLIINENNVRVSDSYLYQLTSEDEEWKSLTIQEKIEACRIPKVVLYDMSDEELIQAIIDFPFIHEVYLYDDIETGIKSLESISDAYKELINRESGLTSLMNYIRLNIPSVSDEITAEEEFINDVLAAIIAFQEKFQDSLTVSDMEKISEISAIVEYNVVQDISPYGAVLPRVTDGSKTPNGNAVPYATNTCNHSASNYHAVEDQKIVQQYGVTLVSSGTCKYNCHSYAWYSTSTSNSFWIDNPAKYMTDGSYSKILTGAGSSSSGVRQDVSCFTVRILIWRELIQRLSRSLLQILH